MRPRFLLDARISPLVAEMLSHQGIEARAIAGSDQADVPDEELLRIAAEEGSIVVTYDTDTMPAHYERLYGKGAKLPGVAYVKAKRIPQADASGRARAIQKLASAIEEGADPLGVYFLT